MTSLPDTLNRDILRLAVPALGALVAEPLFLIVDSALVGHLGITPLAGLGIAFRAKPAVRAQADVAVDGRLDEVLDLPQLRD